MWCKEINWVNFVILYFIIIVKDGDKFCYFDICNCDDYDSCILLFGWCCSDNDCLRDILKKEELVL